MRRIPGPQPVGYYERIWHRLTWVAVDKPGPYDEYWEVHYDGYHVGEFFGRKGWGFTAVIFEALWFRKPDKNQVLMVLATHVLGGLLN